MQLPPLHGATPVKFYQKSSWILSKLGLELAMLQFMYVLVLYALCRNVHAIIGEAFPHFYFKQHIKGIQYVIQQIGQE